jgi:hypothetical protein
LLADEDRDCRRSRDDAEQIVGRHPEHLPDQEPTSIAPG